MAPRLQKKFDSEVKPALQEKFGLKNPMRLPKLERVVINMGLGAAVQNPKLIDAARDDLSTIAGQRAVVTRARKSIAGFKLREGMPIGVMVTLRRDRMWEFMDRMVSTALPQVRDFKGVSAKGFDQRGNYTLGLKDQLIFPEIDYDKVDEPRGMNVTIVTTAKTDEEGRELLSLLGMPFRRS